MPQIELLHTDCMEYMRGLPDKAFDLAIVDPPYGIGHFANSSSKKRPYNRKWKIEWNDQIPGEGYFSEVARISKNRIIWGANYYNCFEENGGAIVWDKGNESGIGSACEIASHSFDKTVTKFFFQYTGYVRGLEDRSIHPCQKPVALYRWLLKNYAKPGQRILDTHLGSGSIAIACDIEGFDLVGCEIDADYIAGARKRLADHQSAPRLFDPEPKQQGVQLSMDAA